MASGIFNYRAFGLNIRSEMECTGALPGTEEPDVYIRLGSVPEQLEDALAGGVLYQTAPGRLLLNVNHVARFLISSGNDILVDIVPGADQGMVLLLLYGSAFGALLHQRGIMALHGSAIAGPRGAVLFAGPSGCGKSTLAGAFYQRGFAVLTDDVCPIDTGGVPTVFPGNPFLMLWADVVNHFGIDDQRLRHARSGVEKYVLPLGPAYEKATLPVQSVYVLEPSHSDTFSLTPIHGIQKVKALEAVTFRLNFVIDMQLEGRHIRQTCDIARQVKVVSVKRPRGGLRLEELADMLAADFA